MNIRHIIIVLASFLICYSAASTVYVPEDGAEQSVWRVSGQCSRMPEVFGPGRTWSLEDAVIESRIVRGYTHYGDSLLGRIQEGRRDLFAISRDTVWAIGTNDRVNNFRSLGSGVPYQITAWPEKPLTVKDTLSIGTVFENLGMVPRKSEVTTAPSGSIAFAADELVQRTTVVHTHEVYASGTLDTYRWYADDAPFAVVEYSLYRPLSGEPDIEETLICPPSEQPALPRKGSDDFRAQAPSRAMVVEDEGTGMPPEGQAATDDHELSCDGMAITVKFMPDSSTATAVRVYDPAGRLRLSAEGDCTLDLTHLPKGTYITDVTTHAGSYTYKILIY